MRGRLSSVAVRQVSGLTLAALWSSGTTYVLFATYARSADAADLGRFVALSSMVAFATQLIDGGSGLLMVRDAAAATDQVESRRALRQGLTRRLIGILCASPPVMGLSLVVFAPQNFPAAIAAGSLLVASALYGFLVQLHQALRRFKNLVVLQALNGVLFLAGAVAATLLEERLSVAAMLSVPAAVFACLGSVGLLLARKDLQGARQGGPRTDGESRAVLAGTLAVAATANADQLLLGSASAAVLASYAGAQRAAFGMAVLSSALMAYLLPVTAAGRDEDHRRLLRLTRGLLIPVALITAAAGWTLAPLAQTIYGDSDLAPPLVLSLLLAAYGLGALSNLPVAVLYTHRRGATVAKLSVTQAVIVVTGVALMAQVGSAIGVAVVVLIGKLTHVLGTARAAARSLGPPLPSSRSGG